MSIGLILLIVLVLFLVGAFPSWGHSRNWGYGPSGVIGVVLVVVVVLLLMDDCRPCKRDTAGLMGAVEKPCRRKHSPKPVRQPRPTQFTGSRSSFDGDFITQVSASRSRCG